jgi:ABC-type sugar transport system ATPase subunit
MLEVKGLSKTFGATKALQDVTLTIRPGEIHGLCGRNGAGKSTLVKILTGVERPEAGTIRFFGENLQLSGPRDAQTHGIAVVDQELSVVPVLTVAENIRLGAIDEPFLAGSRASRRRVQAVLARLGLDRLSPSTLVEDLPMPERQLIEIARLFDRNARLLILDEPTASLSYEDSVKVLRAIRQYADEKTCVLYVSHRLNEVLELCSHVTVFRDGRVVGDHKADAVSHEALVRLIVGEEDGLVPRNPEPSTTTPSAAGDGKQNLSVERLVIPGRVHDFALDLAPGLIVALAGQVGSGTTEVLRALAGLESEAAVRVTCGGRRVRLRSAVAARRNGFFFISNDRKGEGLFFTRTVEQNLVATRLSSLSHLGLVTRRAIRQAARKLAIPATVDENVLPRPVGTLSGGNQQKVFIGRCLDRRPTRLLLLDEPTRGVDVQGRASIHEMIRNASAQGGAVLFASSEPEEILDLADVVVSMQDGHVVSTRPRSALTVERLVAETTQHTEHRAENPAESATS